MASLVFWGCTGIAVYILLCILLPSVRFFWKCKSKCAVLNQGFPLMYEKLNPILGHSLLGPAPPSEEWLKEHLRIMSSVSNRAFLFYILGWKPVLTLCHPDVVKSILKTTEPKSPETFGYRIFADWIGDGLLVSNGPKWFRNRKLLTPAFHFDILKPYIKIYNEATKDLMKTFQEASIKGKSVEICHPVSLCTLNIILRCAFSNADVSVQGKRSPYVDAVMSMSTMFAERVFKPWLYPDTVYNLTTSGRKFKSYCQISHRTAMDVITKRRRALESQGGIDNTFSHNRRYVDFLDILLTAKDEDGATLTNKEIRDEVETFMFEGHDTTKSGISFILYNLARHPEIQQRVRTEVQALLEGRQSDDILWEDLSKMTYLTQCIKESLRLHPPVIGISRKTARTLSIDGHQVPEGTLISIMIWNVHHNPEVWGDDHMTYDPERFSEDNISKMDSHAFIPFSAGPRNCIGQNFAMSEMKVTVARIINRFELSVDQTMKVALSPEVVLRAKDGIFLKFKPI